MINETGQTGGNERDASVFSIFVNILTSPAEAFSALDKHPMKWMPLLLVVGLNAVIIFWYFTILDFDWFVDDTLQNANIPENQLDDARENFAQMSPSTLRLFGILGSSVALVVIYAIQAGYLSLVSALGGHSQKFGHWFSLVVWSGIVVIFSQVGMIVTLLLDTNGQLGQYDLDPLTLRNLGLRPQNQSLEQMMGSVNIPMLWSIFLMIQGYKQWLDASTIKAALVVTVPYLLIFGGWGFFALNS